MNKTKLSFHELARIFLYTVTLGISFCFCFCCRCFFFFTNVHILQQFLYQLWQFLLHNAGTFVWRHHVIWIWSVPVVVHNQAKARNTKARFFVVGETWICNILRFPGLFSRLGNKRTWGELKECFNKVKSFVCDQCAITLISGAFER